MIRKRVTGIALVLLMLFGMFGFAACGAPYNPYEDKKNPVVESECGNFYVQLYNENKNGVQSGTAVVLELTDAGKEKEVLAIPSHVEGIPVTQIGLFTKTQNGFYPRNWGIKNSHGPLQKIYIPYTVMYVAVLDYGWLSVGSPSIRCSEIVFLSEKEPNIVSGNSSYGTFAYALNANIIVSLFFEETEPNLIYNYNYPDAPNAGYYWLDYLTGDNPFLCPPQPSREGYCFVGWYLEPECATQWDEVLPSSANENLNLYAGWDIN